MKFSFCLLYIIWVKIHRHCTIYFLNEVLEMTSGTLKYLASNVVKPSF